jgi:hypothetical protein
VHFIEYTPEIEEARGRGELKRNAFVRLHWMFIDEEPALEVEDLGNSETLLKNLNHFKAKAQELLKQGTLPSENGWGGWLGHTSAPWCRRQKRFSTRHPSAISTGSVRATADELDLGEINEIATRPGMACRTHVYGDRHPL